MANRQSVYDRQHAAIGAKPVWNLAIVTHVEHGKVGVFARFHAAFTVGQSQCPGSVNGRRCDCL